MGRFRSRRGTPPTEEQIAKFQKINAATSKKRGEILEASGISDELNKKRTEINEALKSATPKMDAEEMFDEANKQAGYTEDQIKGQEQLRELFREQIVKYVDVFTEEQRADFPRWILNLHEDRKGRSRRSQVVAKANRLVEFS